MKIFLATLEGTTQSWYESFPSACIYCLRDFHAMIIERYKDSYPSLNLVQDYCKHAYSFIESLEKYYEDDNFMDDEIMEALYENPFQQHTELLEETLQQDQNQQVEDFQVTENDERRSFILDLVEIKEDTQENDVPISENDDDKSNQETDCDEERESCMVEAASNGENRVTNLTILISPELDLHEEVAHSLYEQKDEIFVQVSEKVSLDESLVDDRNVMLGFQESFKVSFLMIDECKDNLDIISYQDDLQYI